MTTKEGVNYIAEVGQKLNTNLDRPDFTKNRRSCLAQFARTRYIDSAIGDCPLLIEKAILDNSADKKIRPPSHQIQINHPSKSDRLLTRLGGWPVSTRSAKLPLAVELLLVFLGELLHPLGDFRIVREHVLLLLRIGGQVEER